MESEEIDWILSDQESVDFDLEAQETELEPEIQLSPKPKSVKKLFLGSKIIKKSKASIRKTQSLPQETLLIKLRHFLNQVDETLSQSKLPTLVLWSRMNTNALEYKNKRVQMNASRMKKKSISFENARFGRFFMQFDSYKIEMYTSVIKDIISSLEKNIICTKRYIFTCQIYIKKRFVL